MRNFIGLDSFNIGTDSFLYWLNMALWAFLLSQFVRFAYLVKFLKIILDAVLFLLISHLLRGRIIRYLYFLRNSSAHSNLVNLKKIFTSLNWIFFFYILKKMAVVFKLMIIVDIFKLAKWSLFVFMLFRQRYVLFRFEDLLYLLALLLYYLFINYLL